jgi:hypothetical protein
MIKFSQRKGLKPIKSILQIDSMDSDLRNSLWNALDVCYWDFFASKFNDMMGGRTIRLLCKAIWLDYFKQPVDNMSRTWVLICLELRKYFLSCRWYEVYDFVEFIVRSFKLDPPDAHISDEFKEYCNKILESELSAYRIVGDSITQITSPEEITAIEDTLALKNIEPVKRHIETALNLLSDRKNPDYRNSIKESISAVEAICVKVSKEKKGTLADALKELESKVKLHPALKKAFDSLYGYTSDADGIRHALLDEPRLYFEDAKFMLVACSAFINYLVSKSARANVKLE